MIAPHTNKRKLDAHPWRKLENPTNFIHNFIGNSQETNYVFGRKVKKT